ncbi:MAG: NfeD family protein, partial [Gammaproteobacteria bacterium]|nr:NfeD family protein [Gammaproteobacteria bacterium]
GVLAVASMVFFRRKLYDRLRGGAQGFDNSTVGEVVEVAEDVPAGGRTRVAMRGSEWTATNVGTVAIGAGTQARIVGLSGAAVNIVAMSADSSDG